jgi:hypothetical protein
MKDTGIASAALRLAASVTAMLTMATLQIGCGATCDRIEEDREEFLARKGTNTDTHVEVLIPFAVAERLVEAQVSAVKPIELKIPGLGQLADYFGELAVAPTRVELRPAAKDLIGFHLDFEVRSDGKKAFAMFMETEIRPEIDLAAGKVILGFTPEALEKVKPGISKDAKKDLGGVIYARIPAAARLFVPRSAVDAAAGTAVELLVGSFYAKAKEKMLPKLAEKSRFELTLPDVPLAAAAITSTAENGGHLRLALVTSLPVRAGIAAAPEGAAPPSSERISVRMSGSTLAELVNWAMAKGLVPDRYDGKGKPKKDGELRPGLDWVRGEERPMKIIMWDLDKPCMRITMAAKPAVAVVDDKLEIKAEDPKTDDVEASAFTKVGVWFYVLWKDAMKLHQKTSARMKMVVAGQELEAVVEKAIVERDEVALEVSLSCRQSAP